MSFLYYSIFQFQHLDIWHLSSIISRSDILSCNISTSNAFHIWDNFSREKRWEMHCWWKIFSSTFVTDLISLMTKAFINFWTIFLSTFVTDFISSSASRSFSPQTQIEESWLRVLGCYQAMVRLLLFLIFWFKTF